MREEEPSRHNQSRHQETVQESELEPLQDANDFLSEMDFFDFFGGGAPCHVDLEEVTQDGLRDVDGEAAEEDGEHGDPFQVVDDCWCRLVAVCRNEERARRGDEKKGKGGGIRKLTAGKEALLVRAVPKDGERTVAKSGEYHNDGAVNGERIEVVLIVEPFVPTGQEVVDQRQAPGRSNGVVRPDVRADSQLLGQSNTGAEELAEERSERSTDDPETEGVEQQLVTSVGVLLPAGELVVNSQADAFLEAFAGVGGVPKRVASALET